LQTVGYVSKLLKYKYEMDKRIINKTYPIHPVNKKSADITSQLQHIKWLSNGFYFYLQ